MDNYFGHGRQGLMMVRLQVTNKGPSIARDLTFGTFWRDWSDHARAGVGHEAWDEKSQLIVTLDRGDTKTATVEVSSEIVSSIFESREKDRYAFGAWARFSDQYGEHHEIRVPAPASGR